jgi:hypothetical protein
MISCPGCHAALDARLERRLQRCRACGATIRSEAVEGGGRQLAYDVEVQGRKQTRRRIEVPWDATQQRRLSSWLLWASVATLGSIALLYALARWLD